MNRFGSELGVAYALAQAMAEITTVAADTSVIVANLRQGIYSLPILAAVRGDPRVRKAIVKGIERDNIDDLLSVLRTSEDWNARWFDLSRRLSVRAKLSPTRSPRVKRSCCLSWTISLREHCLLRACS
jgi:geranylgeranyl pyrophosphate synthase